MTINSTSQYAPSTLGEILENVKAMFSAAGSKVPIQIGKFYETANQGNPPKITFIPELSGSISDALVVGHAACWSHNCSVIVREKPGMNEWDFLERAYLLAGKVIAAIAVAGCGRISWGTVTDDTITKDGKLAGVGVRFSFSFRRDIPHWDDIWSLPQPEENYDRPIKTPSELSDYSPPGAGVTPTLNEATGVTISPTVTPEED